MADRLSAAQVRMLLAIRDTGDFPNVVGMQAHGGLEVTRMALSRRGLITYDQDRRRWALTSDGKDALNHG